MTKSHDSVLIANNTTFCEHHKSNNLGWIFSRMIQLVDHFLWKIVKEPQTDWTLFLNKNIIQELFQTWNIFHRCNKTRTKLLMIVKQNENLNEQQISFPMSKTMRKVTAKTTFRYIHTYPSLKCEFFLLFSLTEINRTPRGLL